MKKKEYRLDEAIKNFYKTDALKTDLAKSVSESVFVKPSAVRSSLDKWLFVFVAILISVGLMYSFSLLRQVSFPALCLILFSVVSFVGLARKEYNLFSKRLLSMN